MIKLYRCMKIGMSYYVRISSDFLNSGGITFLRTANVVPYLLLVYLRQVYCLRLYGVQCKKKKKKKKKPRKQEPKQNKTKQKIVSNSSSLCNSKPLFEKYNMLECIIGGTHLERWYGYVRQSRPPFHASPAVL